MRILSLGLGLLGFQNFRNCQIRFSLAKPNYVQLQRFKPLLTLTLTWAFSRRVFVRNSGSGLFFIAKFAGTNKLNTLNIVGFCRPQERSKQNIKAAYTGWLLRNLSSVAVTNPHYLLYARMIVTDFKLLNSNPVCSGTKSGRARCFKARAVPPKPEDNKM